MLLMPPGVGDGTDPGQLGINPPNMQQLPLSPAAFRRTRATMQEGEQPRYELVISASAVLQQVGLLQLSSADALFRMSGGILVAGSLFEIEGWSDTQVLGQACMYRLLLRAAEPQSLTSLI